MKEFISRSQLLVYLLGLGTSFLIEQGLKWGLIIKGFIGCHTGGGVEGGVIGPFSPR